jgi:hypothetical protein
MALTDAQEEVLCMIGMGEAENLDAPQMLVVDELQVAGLAEWCGETPVLTAAGRAALDQLLID